MASCAIVSMVMVGPMSSNDSGPIRIVTPSKPISTPITFCGVICSSAKKAPAIPLKDIMAALDKRDRGYYNRLTSEQKKAFSSWMMMRYASSVQGKDAAHYIYMTNELVNRDYSEVSKQN